MVFADSFESKCNLKPVTLSLQSLLGDSKSTCQHQFYSLFFILSFFQIMREIQEHKIKIYEFPETDDEEESKLVKKIKVCVFTIVDEWFFSAMTLKLNSGFLE